MAVCGLRGSRGIWTECPPPEQSQSKEVSKQYWSESPEISPSYLQYWAIIERHLNGVSPAGRWWSALSAIFILFPLINLTLNAPIATKVASLSRLLKCFRSLYGKQCGASECFRSLYGKQCGARSDCSYRSSLFWVHTVCFYT